ncbi:alpha/beta hydrolase family protein [Alteromonas sediminis]|nr:prolyl oligopeptidase family serine peptidase [Alteromonas sediminis]
MNKTLLTGALLTALSGSLCAATLPSENIQALGPIDISTPQLLTESPKAESVFDSLSAVAGKSGDKLNLFGEEYVWQPLSTFNKDKETALSLYRFTLSVDRFTQGELVVEGVDKLNVFVAGVEAKKGEKGYSLALPTGDHAVFITATKRAAETEIQFSFEGKAEHDQVTLHKGGKVRLAAKQLFDSETISSVELSDNGEYALIAKRHYHQDTGNKAVTLTELVNVGDLSVIHTWDNGLRSAMFSPDNQSLVYFHNNKLHQLNIDTLRTETISAELEDASGFRFFGNESLVFSWNKEGDDDGDLAKRYQALQDRWRSWRDNRQLYQLDIDTGFIRQLTQHEASSTLLDIDETRNTLLISRSLIDYSAPPHGATGLFELNLKTGEERKIGHYRAFSSARYSSKGLYVTGGPNFAGGKGLNVSEGLVANDYDGQLYHMNLQGEDIQALSKAFDPAINGIHVLKNDDVIFTASEKDRVPLYQYDASKARFIKLSEQTDTVRSWASTDNAKAQIMYAATHASRPQALYTQVVGRKAKKQWDASAAFANTSIAKLNDFDVVNPDGISIDGRVYLPDNFDASKKYPALVYYYGGTATVTRGFKGRYPFNLWAANGYVVYVLQPTGTYGYGQDFSAKHVNAWGDYTVDDIIHSTKAFLEAHPFVDADRVGHLGASYGGFMTMLLATKTDIFAASVSHAGISTLTSYWGEGWWGALYSGVASRNSFPWNNPELYTDHSPIYHADKVTNPILLIHGDSDVNVPVGESHTFYTALKLLDKDVELVEYLGDDHHILARDKTFHWWATILSYFDKHLKDQPEWWEYHFSK